MCQTATRTYTYVMEITKNTLRLLFREFCLRCEEKHPYNLFLKSYCNLHMSHQVGLKNIRGTSH
jgi:hypothetical protein